MNSIQGAVGTGGISQLSTLQASDNAKFLETAAHLGSLRSTLGTQIDLTTLLMQVTTSMKAAEQATQNEKLDTDMNGKRAALDEKQAKLEEAARKIEESMDKHRNAGFPPQISQFLAFLASVMAAVTAAGQGKGALPPDAVGGQQPAGSDPLDHLLAQLGKMGSTGDAGKADALLSAMAVQVAVMLQTAMVRLEAVTQKHDQLTESISAAIGKQGAPRV